MRDHNIAREQLHALHVEQREIEDLQGTLTIRELLLARVVEGVTRAQLVEELETMVGAAAATVDAQAIRELMGRWHGRLAVQINDLAHPITRRILRDLREEIHEQNEQIAEGGL